MGKVIWTDPALESLRDIIEYIAKDSPSYAERFGIQIVESPRRLERYPHSGRIVPEFNDEEIRELFFSSYVNCQRPIVKRFLFTGVKWKCKKIWGRGDLETG